MKNLVRAMIGISMLLVSFNGFTQQALITQANAPLVKELTGRYTSFAASARKGDLRAFRALRTAEANKGIPPDATGDQLKGMAEFMAPELKDFKFMQLEQDGKHARVAYKRQNAAGLSILVQMFEKEGSEWKVGNNHTQDYIGQTPKEADGLKEALKSPEVQFPKK